MAQGRVGVGVALLMMFAGAVEAAGTKPEFPKTASGSGTYNSGDGAAGSGGVVPAGGSLPSGGMTPASPGAGQPASKFMSPSSMQPAPSFLPPGMGAGMPPGATGTQFATPGAPDTPVSSATGIQQLGGLVSDAPPMAELHTGLPDLIPPDPHGGHGHHNGHGAHGCDPCGEHHGIPGYMTPFVPEHAAWFFNGEFLLMRPRYSDFDYVIPSSTPGLATTGPIRSHKYETATGLRVELGRHWGKWDTSFAYTYFTANGDSSFFAREGQVLLPTLTRPGLTDRALTASAVSDLDYQLFDMLAGRRVLVEDNFAIRWLGGFRFADIRQPFTAFYDGLDARGARVETRSRFQGFGPLVGAEAVLAGWKGFHLYGRAIGGLITGRNSNRLIETNDAGQTTYINSAYDIQKVVPMGSIAIGGGWQYRSISLRAGYEITHWQGIFERPRFVDDVSQGKVITRPGNLTLEGLFIQVGLNF